MPISLGFVSLAAILGSDVHRRQVVGSVAVMTLTWLAETEGKNDPFVVRRIGRGGVFPEFKPLGVVKSVKLKTIRSFTRGVPREDTIESTYTRTIHAYIRLKCPHCPGEIRVRQGASYHKNRNTMIRQHLLDCEGWPWIVPPPQKRSKEKPMECRKTLTQPTLDGFAVRSMERDECKTLKNVNPGGGWRVDLRVAGRSAGGGSGCSYSAYSVGSNENIAISTKRDDQDSNPSLASLDTTRLEV